jgi:hypothetical protein
MDLNLLLSQKENYKPMQPGNYSSTSVIKFGEKIAESVNMGLDFDLRKLVVKNGGTLHDVTFALFKQYSIQGVLDNSIYVRKEGDFDLLLHAYLPFDVERYIIAHELGHYVLHAKDKMCFACYNGTGQIEVEAYNFALGFLMPEKLFREQIQQTPDTNYLSFLFQVPKPLIEERKKTLSII